ncbi:MAG: prolyl oligopeptidase family serine peptidase, partial [Gemmatimonadota bacterium]
GTPLTSARTLLEGDTTDVSVDVGSFRTEGRTWGIVSRSPHFFERMTWVIQGDSLAKLDLPLDAEADVVGDRLVVYLRSPWKVDGQEYDPGSLIATSRDGFLAGGRDFQLILKPGPRQTIEGMRTTQHYLLVSMLDEVRPKLLRYRYADGAWKADTIPVPDFGSARVVATSSQSDRFFLSFSGFTQPSTLYLADADGSLKEIKRLPAQFDASGLVTEQHEATSKDGTKIPYFIVHRKGMQHDGTNPTLQYGYGGFEISLTPSYNPLMGVNWLARGGVYVLANIRGGGEFGPSWHRAAMKEHRQLAYDDFIAVAEDLIQRKITSPAHLGIMGGSNGGLLMGVMLTERPDLWSGVVILNPLLDMKRYSHLLAGASWMAEYGNPDIPADWAYISKYSPYQNIKRGVKYPTPFIYTDTRDDRVHPGHARKFAAKLEADGHKALFFENTEGGHGGGVTPAQRAEQQALIYTYLWSRLGGQ